MQPSVSRARYIVITAVAVSAGIAAWYVLGPAGSWMGEHATFWYGWLFAPVAVGELLVGGVHSGAAPWVRLSAMSLANATAWGGLAYVSTRPATSTVRGRDAASVSPPRSNDR